MPNKKCNVCELDRPESEFSPNTKQCKNCGLVRGRLWCEGITPIANDIIKMIVRAQDA